jgi:hypothetical protein
MSIKHMQMKLNISKKVMSDFNLGYLPGYGIWQLRLNHPVSLRFSLLKINRSR